MKDIGKMIFSLTKDALDFQMEQDMKVDTKKEKNMVMEYITPSLDQFMLDSLFIIKFKE